MDLRRALAHMLVACSLGPLSAKVQLDSLRAVHNDRSRPDSVRFLALFDLAWEGYLFSEPDSAYALAEQLQRETRAKGHPGFEARASELKAAVWYVRGDMRKALVHYDTALSLHEWNKDREGQADVIGNMASMRSALGERDEALRLYAIALETHRAIHDSTSIANDLNAMGAVHLARGDHGSAAELFTQALHLQEQLGNDRGISTGRANLGTILVQQGDFAAALPHYREALRIAEKLGDKHMIGKDLEEIGSCLEELDDAPGAMQQFERSLAIREDIEDTHGIVNALNRIGSLLVAQGKAQEAEKRFERSISLALANELPRGLANAWTGMGNTLRALGDRAGAERAARKATAAAAESEDLNTQRDAATLLFHVLHDAGRWKDALRAHLLLVALNDSIMREENQRAVLHNECRYAYETRARTDSIAQALVLGTERSAHVQRVQTERLRLSVALLIGALILALAVFIFLRARLLTRTNAEILAAQSKLLESERRLESSEVRTRIARDVHDQLGSDLTKLVLLSGEVKAQTALDPKASATAADAIERVAAEANRSLGDIVWAIDPHHDSLAVLTERVRAHATRMLQWSRTEHTVHCVHSGPDRSLDPATKRDIYLIFREALNNAIKYAQARHIEVEFITDVSTVRFSVQDDGVGLPNTAGKGHGMGNMQERAERVGGILSIESRDGTSVRFSLSVSTV